MPPSPVSQGGGECGIQETKKTESVCAATREGTGRPGGFDTSADALGHASVGEQLEVLGVPGPTDREL